MKRSVLTSISGLLVASGLLLTGCASTPTAQESVADTGSVAAMPKELEPASPVADAATASAESAPAAQAPAAENAPKSEGISGILKRLSSNRLTLYWRDKGAYTYYVGGIVAAEYKPGTGITLREPGVDDAAECNFSEAGALKSPADPAKQEACKQLMFTLDQELSDQ